MSDKTEQIKQLMSEEILILDGAMGTMIQSYKLEEKDYRGEPGETAYVSVVMVLVECKISLW